MRISNSKLRRLIREELHVLLREDSHVEYTLDSNGDLLLPPDARLSFTDEHGKWTLTRGTGHDADNFYWQIKDYMISGVTYNWVNLWQDNTVYTCTDNCNEDESWVLNDEATAAANEHGSFDYVAVNMGRAVEESQQLPSSTDATQSTSSSGDVPDTEFEGRPGRWKYKISTIPDKVLELDSVTANDIQDIVMKVDSDTDGEGVGNTFKLSDISDNEDYDTHPLVTDVVDAINDLLSER